MSNVTVNGKKLKGTSRRVRDRGDLAIDIGVGIILGFILFRKGRERF